MQDRVWTLLAKKLAGEASLHELEELDDLLRQSPDLHYPLQTISDLWFHHPVQQEDAMAAFDRHLSRMQEMGIAFETPAEPEAETIPESSGRWKKLGWMALAASLVIGAIVYLYPRNNTVVELADASPVPQNEVSTKTGSKSKLQLPDGSQVWLNADSKITYGKEFGATDRQVTLTGEAYFDVVKNPEKPFIIHARNIDIRVVGTAFNVKSYPKDKTTETSLIRGIIEVRIKNRPKEKIILKPNEKLIVAAEDIPTPKNIQPSLALTKKAPQVVIDNISYMPADSTVIETSWTENKLCFRDDSFLEVAEKMERWYGVTIQITDPRLEKIRLTGTFQDETLQKALKALTITTPFTYKIDKGKVIISP